MKVAQSTYDKLVSLKKEGETFDDVVRKLVELDRKYNFKEEIMEYEFLTLGNSKIFQVLFKKNSHEVLYFDGKTEFKNNIKAWNYYPPISDEDKELFGEFISKESSILLLKELPEIETEEFIIRRVGEYI